MTLEESILLLRSHKPPIDSFFQLIAKSIIASNYSAKCSLERKIASTVFMAMPIRIDRMHAYHTDTPSTATLIFLGAGLMPYRRTG